MSAIAESGQSSVFSRIDKFVRRRKLHCAIKANLAKASDAKPRVLASSATFVRHEGSQDRRAAESEFQAELGGVGDAQNFFHTHTCSCGLR